MTVFEFWDMTYGEIVDTLLAYERNMKNTLKERAIMDYKLADLIATNVSRIIDKDAIIPSLAQAYEFLFPEEKHMQDEIKAQKDMEIWKQRMKNFAEYHNRKRGENE
jgi:hypothetical protein